MTNYQLAMLQASKMMRDQNVGPDVQKCLDFLSDIAKGMSNAHVDCLTMEYPLVVFIGMHDMGLAYKMEVYTTAKDGIPREQFFEITSSVVAGLIQGVPDDFEEKFFDDIGRVCGGDMSAMLREKRL